MKNKHLTIRYAVESDIEVLVESAFCMMQETENLEVSKDVIRSGARKILTNRERGFYLVAEWGDNAIGSLQISPLWCDIIDGYTWWFQCLHIRPEYRRYGNLMALVRSVNELASANPDVKGFRSHVHPENRRMQKINTRNGWVRSPFLVFKKSLY